MEAIAISEKASFWKMTDIKASILAFDKIYIPQGMGKLERQMLEGDLRHANISLDDVEYLENKGIIQQTPINSSELVENALSLIENYNNRHGGINDNTRYIFGNILERLVIKELSKKSENVFLPSSSLVALPTLKSKQPQAEVYSLIIDNLPIISEDVPLDEVISFKNEFSKDYQKLLLWSTTFSSGENEKIRKEELSEMIERFREHQNIGDIKFRPGKAELLFQGLGVFKEAFQLKFGSVSKTLATVRKTKAELLEHEMNNPSLPLSYIVKAQDNFNNN